MQENPLTGVEPPPIEGVAPWWPVIGVIVSLLIGASGAVWAAILQFKHARDQRDDKKLDGEREHRLQSEQRKQQIELEDLKQSFEQRQNMFEMLQDQLREHLAEGRLMRKELAEAREELVNRDIASRAELQSRDNTITELRGTIVALNLRISHLEKDVKQMGSGLTATLIAGVNP